MSEPIFRFDVGQKFYALFLREKHYYAKPCPTCQGRSLFNDCSVCRGVQTTSETLGKWGARCSFSIKQVAYSRDLKKEEKAYYMDNGTYYSEASLKKIVDEGRLFLTKSSAEKKAGRMNHEVEKYIKSHKLEHVPFLPPPLP